MPKARKTCTLRVAATSLRGVGIGLNLQEGRISAFVDDWGISSLRQNRG
jgi:hypothetical protein